MEIEMDELDFHEYANMIAHDMDEYKDGLEAYLRLAEMNPSEIEYLLQCTNICSLLTDKDNANAYHFNAIKVDGGEN